ncbi:YqaE/Pmp3 family membrane protein [Deinococcus phoenicis]|uniref:YqaE/Pmp3 family membrane protein n=1 Tax=Deinococcus phoenicis TaxID=1476583 RepID=UPI0012685FD4
MQQAVACPVCRYVGPPRRVTPGSFLIELVLWLFFIIPGVIYSLWRLSARREVCAACGNPQTVPLSTPAGQAILNQNHNP